MSVLLVNFEGDSVCGKGCASRSVDFTHEREHLSTIHSIPDRNVVADGGNFIRRPGFLSVVACSTVAPGRFSDDPGRSITAGRQPRNHGVVGGAAAGTAVGANSRRRANDINKLAGLYRDHDPI